MRLDNGTLVVVADGEKARFLVNAGTLADLKLEEVGSREIENPPTREQGSDKPGRFDDAGIGKSAVDDTDWHEQAKERFVKELAGSLSDDAQQGRYQQLLIVAPAKALGILRQEFHQTATDRLRADIDKDLTNHPLKDIEKILSAA